MIEWHHLFGLELTRVLRSQSEDANCSLAQI